MLIGIESNEILFKICSSIRNPIKGDEGRKILNSRSDLVLHSESALAKLLETLSKMKITKKSFKVTCIRTYLHT